MSRWTYALFFVALLGVASGQDKKTQKKQPNPLSISTCSRPTSGRKRRRRKAPVPYSPRAAASRIWPWTFAPAGSTTWSPSS